MDRRPRSWWPWIYALVALMPATWAAFRSNVNPRARVPDMVTGVAYRPYVYRTLVPLAIRGLDALVPAPARAAADSAVANSPLLRERLRWEPAHATWFAWSVLLGWLSLIAFAIGFARLLRAVAACDPALAGLATVAPLAACAMLVLVPIHFGYQNFVYDFAELALFTLALAALAASRWPAYYACFALALVNKETSLLLTGVFAIWHWRRMSARALAAHVAAQFALAALVLGAIRLAYAHAPGEPLEHHLIRNLTYHPSLRQRLHDAAYVGFWLVALFGVARQPRVALGAALVGGALLATMLFFGFIGEYRDFYEAFALGGLLVAGAVWGTRRTRAAARA
ncbi:MAG TPA: hypothetical protein VL332_07630 [Candidatus Saccharimonadaceae bacterium]|jgi:hypothetical protein|nr:hypothetical protein [Candidatus Saccharimonadaceae bacterium]